MAAKKWTLIDHDQNTHVNELAIRPEDVGGKSKGYSVEQRTLKSGLSAGVTSIHVDNGSFAFDVLPTRGMGIWKAWSGSEEIGWRSPIRGPVHPAFVPLAEPSGLGWLDGFDELLVRCGLESNGAPEFDATGRLKFPLHGRIANRPAHHVEVAIDGDSGEITITGEVEETRFHFLKLRLTTTISTKVGESGFRLRDQVLNISQSPAEIQILYHVNFGQPLLDAGSRVVAPAHTIVPRNARSAEGIRTWDSYSAEQPGFAEQVYFLKLAADANHVTQVLLKNAHGTRGVSLRFNATQLPCFTVWKNTTAASDGYLTGLEPGTNFPNPRSYEGEQGRVKKLEPGASTAFDLQLMLHRGSGQVVAAERTVTELQRGVTPKIFDQPQPGWCAS
jgi:hypothetical protein